MASTWEIEIVDFKEDPASGAAFVVLMEIHGPEDIGEPFNVFFSENFLIEYFHIPWFKDLPKEEKKLLHEKRDLFIRWAVIKAEHHCRGEIEGDRVLVDYDTDGIWAEKVEQGKIKPKSEQKEEHLYRVIL